jgi:hypothetical protein
MLHSTKTVPWAFHLEQFNSFSTHDHEVMLLNLHSRSIFFKKKNKFHPYDEALRVWEIIHYLLVVVHSDGQQRIKGRIYAFKMGLLRFDGRRK